jgi:hypothetical protein
MGVWQESHLAAELARSVGIQLCLPPDATDAERSVRRKFLRAYLLNRPVIFREAILDGWVTAEEVAAAGFILDPWLENWWHEDLLEREAW